MIGPLYPTVVIEFVVSLKNPSSSSESKVIDGAISVPSLTKILPANLLSPATVNFSVNVVAISAKNIRKKRKFKFNKKIFYSNPLEIFKNHKVDILFEAIG